MQRTIRIESSQFATSSYWVPGSEYWAEDCYLEYPPELDCLTDDELFEVLDDLWSEQTDT